MQELSLQEIGQLSDIPRDAPGLVEGDAFSNVGVACCRMAVNVRQDHPVSVLYHKAASNNLHMPGSG
jgi:hypothetical protein